MKNVGYPVTIVSEMWGTFKSLLNHLQQRFSNLLLSTTKTKNWVGKITFFTSLQISLISDLIKDSYIFTYSSAVSFVVICYSGWSIWKKLASFIYVVGKGSSILITLSYNCGYLSLTLHWNSTSDSYRFVAVWNYEAISMNCYIKIHRSLLYFEWIFYPWMIL